MKKIPVLVTVIMFSCIAYAAPQKKSSTASHKERSPAATASAHKIVAPSELQWGDGPAGLPAGAKMAVLDGDPAKKGSFTVRLQTPDGYKVAPHTHPTAERITVITGTFHLGMGDKFD